MALTVDAGISTNLAIEPGQDVRVSGDPGLSESPRWGSGGFAVRQFGSLSLSYVTLTGLLSVVVVGGSLVLSSCDVRVSAAVVR